MMNFKTVSKEVGQLAVRYFTTTIETRLDEFVFVAEEDGLVSERTEVELVANEENREFFTKIQEAHNEIWMYSVTNRMSVRDEEEKSNPQFVSITQLIDDESVRDDHRLNLLHLAVHRAEYILGRHGKRQVQDQENPGDVYSDEIIDFAKHVILQVDEYMRREKAQG